MVGMMMGMGSEKVWKKGPWTLEEDHLLTEYVTLHGEGRWSSVARFTGLNRSGKSCRLRWVNYLKPGLKKGQLTLEEEAIIFELHAVLGNKWSTIAKYLPGRTDNEIKNYWRTHFKKKDKSSESHNNKKKEKRRAKRLVVKQKKNNNKQSQEQPQQHDHHDADRSNIIATEPNLSDVTTTLQDSINVNEVVDQGGMGMQVMNINNNNIPDIIKEDQYNYLPNFMDQDQCYFPINPFLWTSEEEETPELPPEQEYEEGLWVSLWNLEDPRHQEDHVVSQCNKYAMQNYNFLLH